MERARTATAGLIPVARSFLVYTTPKPGVSMKTRLNLKPGQKGTMESAGLRGNLLQIRLAGPYPAAFSVNRTTIALQNRLNLFSTSRIFAWIS